jgi:predicted dithiol-disulfide oxidoreductase (DUF899 family)
VQEKAHTRAGDAIAAARRRLPVEAMDYSYAPMDFTAYGRQESWEDSPAGWPRQWRVDSSNLRTNGRPIAQWSRIEAGRSDDLTGP